MSAFNLGLRLGGAFVLCLTAGPRICAQDVLEADAYVAIVLGAHPGAAQGRALRSAAEAERTAARQFPDPVFEYSRGRATPSENRAARSTEHGYSLSQTIPWPGALRASIRAGDRAADSLRARADGIAWDLAAEARAAFARLEAARALLHIAVAAEGDARSLRDLVTRRAELGEARESDRIKTAVEWLRQQRRLSAAERESDVAEATVRALAVQPLPAPLVIRSEAREPLPRLDVHALVGAVASGGPRLRAAKAEVERQSALLSVARRARVPEVDVTVFKENEVDRAATGFKLGVKVPLWNANRGEIARADAASHLATAEAARAAIEVLSALQGRLKELQLAGDQAVLLEREILPAAQRSLDLVRLTFEAGETSLLDLLDAQRTLRDTQTEATEARLALALSIAEVQRLVGPDFNPWR